MLGRISTRLKDEEDPDLHEFEEIEETAYTGAMATIIKDMQHLLKQGGSKHPFPRVARILFSILVLVILITIQFYVLITIKTFVTSPAVRSIRQVYDTYERTMYHGHVKDTGWGFALGIGGKEGPFFDPTQFSKLDNDLKGSLCLIPFSQPAYLSLILFIWSLAVIGELKACWTLCRWLQVIPTDDDISKSMQKHDAGGDEEFHVIVGLPIWFKSGLLFAVIVPRFLASMILFWLGCRWLSATLDFTEVLINAIALEFVISLNSVIYHQLVSDRSKRDLGKLRLHVKRDGNTYGKGPTIENFIGTFGWALFAVLWIYLYLSHFQMVLPGYQWDVRGPCSPWVAKRFNFWRI